ncbi:MAG: ABC transporter permease, partial [Aristaeellaceae bacterium]
MSETKKATVHESLFHLTKRTDVNPVRAMLIRLAAIVLGMVVCGLTAFLLIDKLHDSPEKITDFYACFIKGSFASERKLWKFLKNMAILQCISLAVTPAFRMRFWNIGAEGQTLMGVLGAITVAFYFGGKLPEWQLLILMFLAALIYGAVWAVIPALFKARWNTNETLFTLMMNYVATYVVSYFLVIWVPSGSSTLGKLKYGKLPPLPFGNQYLLIILIVLALTVALYIYLRYSKQGYEISVVGESMRTAQYSGINVQKVIIRTMVVSGLLCGLAGFLIGAGLDQSVTTESVGGQGFTAIIVSWLANFNPL